MVQVIQPCVTCGQVPGAPAAGSGLPPDVLAALQFWLSRATARRGVGPAPTLGPLKVIQVGSSVGVPLVGANPLRISMTIFNAAASGTLSLGDSQNVQNAFNQSGPLGAPIAAGGGLAFETISVFGVPVCEYIGPLWGIASTGTLNIVVAELVSPG